MQLVNQHSQRINALEIDKIAIEDVRKGNAEWVGAAKLSPVFGKDIALQNVGKLDTFSESVTGLSNNLSNHANGNSSQLLSPSAFVWIGQEDKSESW